MTRDILWLNGQDCSTHGHDWRQDGGRACDHPEKCSAKYPSQPVFKCTRCPAIDYGDRPGPGWDHCRRCQRQAG